MIRRAIIIGCCIMLLLPYASAQNISRDEMIFLTSAWQGDRFDDGRPWVPDAIVERMSAVSIEEAWGVIRGEGYHNQFEGNWETIHDDIPIVGRALTAQYMPNRPDFSDQIKMKGEKDGRIGSPNSITAPLSCCRSGRDMLDWKSTTASLGVSKGAPTRPISGTFSFPQGGCCGDLPTMTAMPSLATWSLVGMWRGRRSRPSRVRGHPDPLPAGPW